MQVICNKAGECEHTACSHRLEHMAGQIFSRCCTETHKAFGDCIVGSYCIQSLPPMAVEKCIEMLTRAHHELRKYMYNGDL